MVRISVVKTSLTAFLGLRDVKVTLMSRVGESESVSGYLYGSGRQHRSGPGCHGGRDLFALTCHQLVTGSLESVKYESVSDAHHSNTISTDQPTQLPKIEVSGVTEYLDISSPARR